MDKHDGFYTLNGYMKPSTITPAMEDYIEMIYRLISDGQEVRVGIISKLLHVRPSSVSKMVRQLSEEGYVIFERYGMIKATEKGRAMGAYLIYRHDVVHKLLCMINGSTSELELVEKIEHFIDPETVENIKRFTDKK